MRQFAHRQFGGGSGGGGGGPPDLSGGNLSQFETYEHTALDSYYAIHGINGEYFTKADGVSRWIVAVMLSRIESLEYEAEMQVEREILTVMLRRYAGASHLAVERPAKGDRLSIPSLDGTRKYTLTETPVVSSGQLEWKAEFSRSKQVKGGGQRVVLSNS